MDNQEKFCPGAGRIEVPGTSMEYEVNGALSDTMEAANIKVVGLTVMAQPIVIVKDATGKEIDHIFCHYNGPEGKCHKLSTQVFKQPVETQLKTEASREHGATNPEVCVIGTTCPHYPPKKI